MIDLQLTSLPLGTALLDKPNERRTPSHVRAHEAHWHPTLGAHGRILCSHVHHSCIVLSIKESVPGVRSGLFGATLLHPTGCRAALFTAPTAASSGARSTAAARQLTSSSPRRFEADFSFGVLPSGSVVRAARPPAFFHALQPRRRPPSGLVCSYKLAPRGALHGCNFFDDGRCLIKEGCPL
jgi:hypothetical protein